MKQREVWLLFLLVFVAMVTGSGMRLRTSATTVVTSCLTISSVVQDACCITVDGALTIEDSHLLEKD